MLTRLVFDDKERVGAWVAEQVEQTAEWGSFYAMGVESAGEITAGIVFHQFNDSNAVCHIAVRRPGKQFIELLRHGYNYVFNVCGLKRLTGMVEDENKKALKLDLKMGFEHEFTMKSAGNGGQDLHVLVLWPENFRYEYDL